MEKDTLFTETQQCHQHACLTMQEHVAITKERALRIQQDIEQKIEEIALLRKKFSSEEMRRQLDRKLSTLHERRKAIQRELHWIRMQQTILTSYGSDSMIALKHV